MSAATLLLHHPHHLPTISSSLTNNPNPKIPSKHQKSQLSLPKRQEDSTPNTESNNAIKTPTAPWMMKSHTLLQPSEPKAYNFNGGKSKNADRALSGKEMRGRKAMGKIMQKVENLKQRSDFESTQMSFESLLDNIGDGGSGAKRMPWVKDERFLVRRVKKERVVAKAELELGGELLWRLRREAAKMKIWVKVKKAGVTPAVVDEILRTWRRSELAMVRFDVPLCRNMDRAREILELKTGGLVVWSNKDFHVIYRGSNYQWTWKYSLPMQSATPEVSSPNISGEKPQDNIKCTEEKSSGSTSITTSNTIDEEETQLAISLGSQSVDGSLYERETNRLLDGLGPRYIDWWMQKPLPVDADLLPEVVSGFMPPVRLCPPHSRSKLTDDELTYLRKHAYCLPTHFVLGRNRKLQGLAAAILKLWDKSLIAKIAVKYGVPNTDHKQMAYELKATPNGGVLILCNKFYIILYRGKDFLHGGVANLVEEREVELSKCQFLEEVSRLGMVEPISMTNEQLEKTSTTGTLSEFQDIQTEFGGLRKEKQDAELELEGEKERLIRELKLHERRLFILEAKIEKSEKELSKLNSSWKPSEQDADREMMTEEERLCFRKIGLKMNSCLVLGRRGVFDGVIEGLHQHWKHREVVRVITMQKAYSRVMYTAKLLEAESGGIIVSVDKLKEGYGIIIYRGKTTNDP